MKKDIVYISKNFKVTNKENAFFFCDTNISDIIITLNKKGYKTNSSCGGHYKKLDELIFEDRVSKKDSSKEKIKSFIEPFGLKIINEDDNFIFYQNIVLAKTIYIKLDSNQIFPYAPKNFTLDSSKNHVFKPIEYFNENIKKDRKSIEDEINKAILDLKKWSFDLPNLNIDQKK